MHTISLQNTEPVGTVVIKKNTVQRRISDRVLWDRLANESPVYLGDLIRVAEVSAATLNIENNKFELDENTLIRITRSPDGGSLQIILDEGNLSVTAGDGMFLDIDGHKIHAEPGAVLSAAKSENGLSLQVNEGMAHYMEEDGMREILTGEAISIDENGVERNDKTAVVLRPSANAHFLKNLPQPLDVDFIWNRVNMSPNETLRLEIAADRNFSRSVKVYENLDNRAQTANDSGHWYWRLLFEDSVMSEGHFNVADASSLKLISPATNSVIPYQNYLPILNYQWSQVEEADFYNLEVCDNSSFINPKVQMQTAAVSFEDSDLGEGIWYWRVTPVFPSVYEGTASSQTAVFKIEQTRAAQENIDLRELAAAETPPAPVPAPDAPQIILTSPANGARIDGLTALRQQTSFSWSTNSDTERTRFVLSRNSNPLQGRAAVEITNPARTIRLDSLGEGTWYWTVEVRTSGGVTAVAPPRRLDVLSIPLLPVPQNMLPERDYQIGLEELQYQKNIVFAWSQVAGANAYIFTLYHQTESNRRQIFNISLDNQTVFTLDSSEIIESGMYYWQIEAVNRRNGTIEQHGRIAENIFFLDLPSLGPIRINEPGVLYGN